MRKCGGKEAGGGETEGGDEMCIPQQGRDTARMCVSKAHISQNYWEVT